MTTPEQRAERLVRLYPRPWRERYGDEFIAMLTDEIRDRPRSLARTVDLVRAGILTRLQLAGVCGEAVDGAPQLRAGLVTIAGALGVFLAAAVAIWAQLTIGWRWSAPAAHTTRSGMVLLSVAMALFGVVAVAAVAPLAWSAVRTVVRGRTPGLPAPLLMTVGGGAVLIAGSIYFDHGWPGSGGHEWAGRNVVPVAVARVCWAATVWISTYWAHPHALLRFPGIELAWMVISPAALLITVLGAARALRRLPMSHRLMRYESWLGALAALAMATALAGAASWVVAGAAPGAGLYRTGAIDIAAVAVMSGTLLLAFTAARRNITTHLTAG